MGKAPKPDPAMGRAAELSAKTGQEMLEFMRGQAGITNQWAAEDRARDLTVFRPLQDQYIADAKAARDPAFAAARSAEGVADVRQQFAIQRGADTRRLTAMGVRPDSGRYGSATRAMGTAEALGAAGAANLGRRQAEARADTMQANAINLGAGLGVNPGQAMGLSNGAGQAGFQGAMSGYGQQASILKADYDARMDAYNAKMGAWSAALGALGSIAGATNGFGMMPQSWR